MQRTLSFYLNDVYVQALPDVIVFREKQAPLILDWKTYRQDSADHYLQLGCYALALTRCNPHADFPSFDSFLPSQIELLEVQLMTNKTRYYHLTDDECRSVEDLIIQSSHTMRMAMGELDPKQTTPLWFPATNNPQTCTHCSFKSVCWEEL